MRVVGLAVALVLMVAWVPLASAQCGGGHVVAETCGEFTWEGCCAGNTMTWCSSAASGGPLCERDCAAEGDVCGWSTSVGSTCMTSFVPPTDGTVWQCCAPQCAGKACGADDACGGVCTGPEASCDGGKTCAPDGVCCQQQCAGKTCGPDGCGGTCGDCGCGETCADGACVFMMCKQAECGADGCGHTCGTCPGGQTCTPWGSCCVPTCNGAQCGDDGCGGTCGVCRCGERCQAGACVFEACAGMTCGDDGCGGECGHCDPNESCVDGQCAAGWVCDPDYQGGDDGCDCECGAYDPDCDDSAASIYGCEDWQTCDAAGHCKGDCVPDCDGKQCGDDGCGKQCGACPDGTMCDGDDQCAAGWVCNPTYQGDGYACDCGCGAYDPDCDDPDNWVTGCELWQTCDLKGVCTPETCTPDCHAKVCGADGCGGSCGGCPLDADQCVEGQCLADPCLGVTADGCCAGNTLRRCSYGALTATDCAATDSDAICGWDADSYYPEYACGTTVDPEGDPSGDLPMACPACQPGCAGKECGSADGCGGTCGCPAGLQCQAGQCFYCAPQCYGKVCGDDGCGGTCGACGGAGVCVYGQCCTPACDGKTCGDDGCGGTCGSCGYPSTCIDDQCCTPACDGVTCGNDDGCGGTCGCDSGSCVAGTCQGGCGGVAYEGCCDGSVVTWCSGGSLSSVDCATDPDSDGPMCGWDDYSGYYWCGSTEAEDASGVFPRACPNACTPDCNGKSCDQDNGCGHACGCGLGLSCEAGQCVACVPDCLGRVCGDDGCGGSCGACGEGLTCHEYGVCVDPCQGLAYEGCCDGETLRYCDAEQLNTIECDSLDGACGWNAAGFYDCGTDGAADPSGTYSMECPQVCVPNCAGLECGPDGCGGICGQCAQGTECKQGTCAVVDVPNCAGKECGDDGLGGSCGACGAGEACSVGGQCEPTVTPDAVDDTAADTTADVTSDKAANDVPAPDATTGDTADQPDNGGVDRSGGGGGGCTVEARPSTVSPLFGLFALLGAALLLRRRATR